MKKILKRITASLCAGMILTASAINSVGAQEEESPTLPSGLTIEALERNLKDTEDTTVEDSYASASIGVFQGDKVLYTGYFGQTDMENNINADENSVYEWGSISKTLVWVSVMQLWEQGRIDLERDVREYLPEDFFKRLSYDEPITMLNLMNHNAGWQETTRPVWETEENEVKPLKDALQAIEPAQINPPGEVSAYSNYGAGVAGYVVECITGQDFCEYVHEHIFAPLEMEHTALNPTHSDNEWVYNQRSKMKSYKFTLGNTVNLGNCLNYVSVYPAGGATGTLSDLMTYAMSLADEHTPLFENKETWEYMFTGTEFYGDSDIPMGAHGFWCSEYSVRTYGHSGATTAGQANMLIDLESKTGLVIMTNEPNGNVYLAMTPMMVFGALSPDKYASGEVKKSELKGYYLSARSTHTGMLKFIPYLTAISADKIGEVYDIGNGVYSATTGGEPLLLGSKEYSDGSKAIQQPSADMMKEDFYLAKLILLTAYIMTAVISIYMLIIKRKLKKYKKWNPYSGCRIITVSQITSIVSVILLFTLFVIFSQNQGGIPFASGAVIGVMQIICAMLCAVSLIASAVTMIKKKSASYRYILSIVANAVVVTAIVYFEMYRFWVM
ncbi:MAG: beta-lactamase family protein [Ruminococcus sp.]|nr:beta-lactamase family protein [Ruminococcus sp.]